MNRTPNHRGGSQHSSNQPRQQNSPQQRPRLTPQQIAARRAYMERRRREIRRNRIILGIICVVLLLMIIFIVSVIVRGIGAAVSGSLEDTGSVNTTNPDSTITDNVWDTDSQNPAGTDAGDILGTTGPAPVITEPTKNTEEVVQPEADLSYEAMQFSADLRDFEKYMNPTEERDDYLILVNAGNPLSATDVPSDLVEVTNTRTDRQKQLMRKTAEKALQALYSEAHAQGMMSPNTPSGYPLSVTSAYRSYETQNYLFSNYTQQELASHPGWTKAQAEAEVETYSCRPGTSEHQTGLSCDMHTLTGADVSFANYEQAKWLEENSWKFGFILRFPKNKVAQTGISYEPWHFRYVGRYHAYRIWSQGLCLEEYIAQLNG